MTASPNMDATHTMSLFRIDWNDAYANAPHIPNGLSYPARWQTQAQAWREQMQAQGRARLSQAYGSGERQHMDVFLPSDPCKGIAVFVHGGFWHKFDSSTWSHFAAGALARGFMVVLPNYTLAPQARIAAITQEVSAAIAQAALLSDGPLMLAGHSAGGHLVTRMVCEDSLLPTHVQARIHNVLSISGVHDLRPMLWTDMNQSLQLSEREAETESPVLHRPLTDARITAWVGSDERPAFITQNDALFHVWSGLGANIHCHHEPKRHHFDVIDGLQHPDSDICRAWLT
ncbi:MAG: hypothetical protein RL357_780 [Pseudomonadota bacterium]